MASSPCGSFEVQAYQCTFEDGPGTSFVGFAVRVDGSKIVTIIDKKVSNPNGAQVAPVGVWTAVKATDKCAILYVSRQDWDEHPGYEMAMNLQMAEFKPNHGVCTSPDSKDVVKGSEVLFSKAEMQQLCQKCPSASCNGFQGNLLETEQPQNSQAVCQAKGIAYNDARSHCAKIKNTAHGDDPFILDSCIYDYCVANGNPQAVDGDVDAELAEEAIEALD